MKSNYMLVVENLIRKDISVPGVMADIVDALEKQGESTEYTSRVVGRPNCKLPLSDFKGQDMADQKDNQLYLDWKAGRTVNQLACIYSLYIDDVLKIIDHEEKREKTQGNS